MVSLTLLVVSVALADSINPSTIVPSLWLAAAQSAGVLAAFTLGAFAVYLAGGVVLVLGPGAALMSFLHHLHGPLEHGLQAAGGVVVLLIAVVLWQSRSSPVRERRPPRSQTRQSAFALGAGIMAVELPTAFMYFGAISAVLAARLSVTADLLLLVIYNALFVAPLVAIGLVRRLLGDRADRWIVATESRVRRTGQLALTGVAGAAGTALLSFGVVGLLAA